jgi:hypothetical protein
MCYGIIKSQLRDWYVRQKTGSRLKQRSVDEILIKFKESVRAKAKSGREENRKDTNYYSGYVDALKWVMKER